MPFYRAPPKRKSKDVNSIKRVRAKRSTTRNIDEQGEQFEHRDEVIDDKDDVIDEQQVGDLFESYNTRIAGLMGGGGG